MATGALGYNGEMRTAHHVMLYGPPGAGKLTVARALVERYGFGLLDNHIAVDAALRLFDFGSPGFAKLCQQIRIAMLAAAADEGRDVVSTFAYAHGVDDDTLAALLDTSTTRGTDVTVVQLLPTDEAIRQRIVSDDRRRTNKISDLALFDSLDAQYDMRTPFPGTHLHVDNTDTPATVVADQIAAHAGLTPTSPAPLNRAAEQSARRAVKVPPDGD